ncbi:MAG: hypothetical protein AAF378_14675 [Cyanobacteria bacterium P01_A01_bin.84]
MKEEQFAATNAIQNQRSTQRLVRSIELSEGQFALILVRCNYQQLREQVLQNLRNITSYIYVRELTLSPESKALHTAIISELFLDNPAVASDSSPMAVMVFGLESNLALEDLLTSINQARDIYADTFNFPVVLWLQDEVATLLSRLAPDFKSWAATTIKFDLPQQELINLVKQETESLFNKILEAGTEEFLSNAALDLDPKSQHRREIESVRGDLMRLYGVKLDTGLDASLEFVLGRDNYANDQIEEALVHYQRSLEVWQLLADEETNRSAKEVIEKPIENNSCDDPLGVSRSDRPLGIAQSHQKYDIHFTPTAESKSDLSLGSGNTTACVRLGVILFHLGLCYRRMADLRPGTSRSYWRDALLWFRKCLDVFEKADRKDLVAKFILPACEICQRLEAWNELKQLADKSLKLHHEYGSKVQLAQDYGFLATVAIANTNWVQAYELIKEALSHIENTTHLSRQHESQYLLLLGRTQQHLGEWQEAVNNLEWAKVVCELQYEPFLYLEIIYQLRSLYFSERHDYLEAFRLKQEQIQIEHQYGIRAFIGASQLQPQRYRINPFLQSQQIVVPPEGIASEIAVSGRQKDINRLVERITRADCKLTVIHGPSGVGKSSILRAGLVPALKQKSVGERKALPIVISVYTDWLTALAHGLNQVIAQTDVSVNLEITPYLVLEKLQLLSERNYTIVLIFDQFEEFFFVSQTNRQRTAFYKFFSQCLNIPFVKILLSLREDYLHYLLEFERHGNEKGDRVYDTGIINQNILDKDIRYYLGKFSKTDASEIIYSLTKRSRYELSNDLVEQLVEDLARDGGKVHPIELQIVGAQLQAEKINTVCEYQQSGGSQKLVERWLEEVIKDCGRENEQFAWQLLFELTDDKGTRPLKSRAELLNALLYEIEDDSEVIREWESLSTTTEIVSRSTTKETCNTSTEEIVASSAILELILEILVGSGLVLKVREASCDRYQLVHDYLVVPIRQKNSYGIIVELEKVRYEKTQAEVAQQLSQNQLNSVVHRRLKEARIAGSVLAAMVGCIGGLWWQADFQKRAALHQSLRAERSETNLKITGLTVASEALFASNKQFDALLESLRAWRQLRQSKGVKSDTQIRVTLALQQAVYGVTELNRLEGHTDIVWGLSFSPDGKLLASGSLDKTIKIWRKNGSLIQTLEGHTKSITGVSFSPDGKILASASLDNTIRLWKHNSNLNKSNWAPYKILKGHADWVYGVAFSPDGKTLASASKDGTIRLWNNDGKLLKILRGHQGWVNWVSFSHDGKFIASASEDKTVKIWRRNGTLVSTLSQSRDHLTFVTFSPNGKYLAAAGHDNKINIWRRENSKTENSFIFRAYKTLDKHTGTIWSLSFSPDSKQLVSAGDDNLINLWKVQNGKLLKTFKGHSDAVASVSFSPDGKLLASASYDKTLKLWNLNPPKLSVLEGHDDSILSVVWSPDGKILASGSIDNTIKLWLREKTINGFKTKLYKTLVGHTDRVKNISFHPSGQILASASYDNTIKLWRQDGSLIRTIKGHKDSVKSVSFSPKGKLLISAGKDKTIKLWNLEGKLLATLAEHTAWINNVGFSPDGKIFASASDDKTIKLWNRHNQTLKTVLPHDSWVLGFSFSPDGSILASASWDNTIRLWRRDGTLLKTLLKGYSDSVNAVDFSPNSEIIAAASWDSTVKLWSRDGKLIKTLNGHNSPVLSVNFSPDGKTLASASDDSSIILWNLDLNNLLKRGCLWVGDYLKYNRNVDGSDRNLCEGVPVSHNF